MTDPKPPVPSDEEDQRVIDELFADATRNRKTTRMVPAARIAELESELERTKAERLMFLEGEADSDARCEQFSAEIDRLKIAHSNSVTRLEAEVAELRKRERELEAELDECESEAGEAIDSVPRRTPELTERVAIALATMNRSGWQFALDDERARYRTCANQLLDVVFGKEQG